MCALHSNWTDVFRYVNPFLPCLNNILMHTADLFYEGLCLISCEVSERCSYCMTKLFPVHSTGLFHFTTYDQLNDIRANNRLNNLTTLNYKCGDNDLCGGCIP